MSGKIFFTDNLLLALFSVMHIFMTVCCYVMYDFRSESMLYSCLNVKELLARSRLHIWSLSDSNRIWTHNLLWHDTNSQMHCADKYSQHSSIISPVWLNGWLFLYKLKWLWVQISLLSHIFMFWNIFLLFLAMSILLQPGYLYLNIWVFKCNMLDFCRIHLNWMKFDLIEVTNLHMLTNQQRFLRS